MRFIRSVETKCMDYLMDINYPVSDYCGGLISFAPVKVKAYICSKGILPTSNMFQINKKLDYESAIIFTKIIPANFKYFDFDICKYSLEQGFSNMFRYLCDKGWSINYDHLEIILNYKNIAKSIPMLQTFSKYCSNRFENVCGILGTIGNFELLKEADKLGYPITENTKMNMSNEYENGTKTFEFINCYNYIMFGDDEKNYIENVFVIEDNFYSDETAFDHIIEDEKKDSNLENEKKSKKKVSYELIDKVPTVLGKEKKT